MLNYGIIGNCKTNALVNKRAGIEWFCYPDHNSPSVFAKILDKKQGGSFELAPKGSYKVKQRYHEQTNILETTFTSNSAKFVVYDFFPRYRKLLPKKKRKLFKQNNLVRVIKPLRGKPFVKVKYEPRLNYAKGENRHRVVKGKLATRNKHRKLTMVSNVDYDFIINQLYFKVDCTKYFVIGDPKDAANFNATKMLRLLNATRSYWKKWVSTLVLPEENKQAIIRSALTLKLLTYSETGAIIAAATTSIPEELGTERTWDYRFCWVRDAVFTVDAFKKIGRDHEAKKLMEFMFENSMKQSKPLQLMYGINGEIKLTEKKLEYLAGFKDSRPVRVGNAAYAQKQNDIYGSLIDLLYLYYVFYEYEKKMTKKYWNFVNYLVKEIEKHWREKDHGIWEFRKQMQHFTYSKLMCFVGVDRALRIAQHFEKHKKAEEWAQLRDTIREDLLKKAWNEKRRAFTMHYGSDEPDAAALKMSYHNFLEHDDPRLVNTIKTIHEELTTRGLVQRYKVQDDFGTSASAFTICSFWLMDALFKIGEEQEARKMYKRLRRCANPLGLYSEDLDLKTNRLIGNFPQAYTHIAMINTSLLQSEWQTHRKKILREGKPYRLA
ncbi:glycoside hydrolase family 15 protein [Candidatus Woesearchaeota archaeon]|nr:glycoside hydrolase family 15 protein [Candidatus Woesearchaeota archaeon]